LGSAVIGLYFYQGNYGVLYDYYMTGYYLIFVLLVAVVLGYIWRIKIIGKLFILYFFYLFFMNNIPVTWAKITDGCDGPQSICFLNQKQAIDWIYKDLTARILMLMYMFRLLFHMHTIIYLSGNQTPIL